MNTEIKVNGILRFDSEKDKEIIDKLNDLSSRHKLTEYITNLIREDNFK